MSKIFSGKRNTRNSNKSEQPIEKQQKMSTEMDISTETTITQKVSFNDNTPVSSNSNTTTTLQPTMNTPSNNNAPSTSETSSSSSHHSTSVDWAKEVENTMQIDQEDDNISLSEEYLKDAAAETAATITNSKIEKGKNPENKEPIAKLADDDFVKIFKPTRFVAHIAFTDLSGKSSQDHLKFVQHLMIGYPGFLGAKINHRTKGIDVFFSTEYDLLKMIEKPHESLNGKKFKAINLKSERSNETGRTLKIIDIPLYVKSDVIKEYFAKKGTITRFSMITRGPWQQAYVVFEDRNIIQPFYFDQWSIQIMDFNVRVSPTDLSDDYQTLRKEFCCKLTGLPFNTTAQDLASVVTQSKAKTCFIPRTRNGYKPHRFAYLQFASAKDLADAIKQQYKLNNYTLYWILPDLLHCFKCGNPDHDSSKCTQEKKSTNQYRKLYDRFRPAQYRPRPNFINKKSNSPTQSHKSNTQSSHSLNKNNKSISYADAAKQHNIKNGTAKGGSMHDQLSINKRLDILLEKMDLMNTNFEQLTQQVNELTFRIEAIENLVLIEEPNQDQFDNEMQEENNYYSQSNDEQETNSSSQNTQSNNQLSVSSETLDGSLLQSPQQILHNPYHTLKAENNQLKDKCEEMANQMSLLIQEVRSLKEDNQSSK